VAGKTKLHNKTPIDNKLKVIYTLVDKALGHQPKKLYF